MHPDIQKYNASQTEENYLICNLLSEIIMENFPEAENKIWHAHPVWFLDGNPILGFSKLKAGIRLLFWSGASFEEKELKIGTGKFKDAAITFTNSNQINKENIIRWIQKSKRIQWDYKNIVKRKGVLERLI
ncbi:DUF1801 domain-containing protein [Flavobacterium sp.]|uniref:DUF1801 domain-containing protein n=1 Tax=Flavobacterium sp. TaxID=239 RepID=UPI001B65A54D|nr:DUF1801 domain-containing protein [Flavobacterium sp.]MBP6127537.1 DUF1801 domain-containing protein [Flavobacterium sp.]